MEATTGHQAVRDRKRGRERKRGTASTPDGIGWNILMGKLDLGNIKFTASYILLLG